MELEEVYSGAVLRAALCKQCSKTLAVAVDEETSMRWIKVRHKTKAVHEVTYNKQPLTVWNYNKETGWGFILEDGYILRVEARKEEQVEM